MHSLFSNRLRLLPLSLEQLYLLAESRRKLEKSLKLGPSGLELSDPNFLQEFDEATAAYIIPKMEQMPERANWLTHWLIIHQQENRTIGGIGVSGFPDCEGATMMGYFIDRRYEGQGYATEAVSCLLKWLFACPDLQSVVADTLLDGIGSQTVLQRNDFVLEGRTEEGLRWRKSR